MDLRDISPKVLYVTSIYMEYKVKQSQHKLDICASICFSSMLFSSKIVSQKNVSQM